MVYKNDSNDKYSCHEHLFMSQDTFSGLKNKKKKWYMEMIEKFYLET